MIAEERKGSEGEFGIITLEGLETLTQKGLNEEFVIESNKELTEAYKHIVVSYGFQDFHSIYLYALSNTQKGIMKYDSGTPKDYSSMSRVRRTIVRDGRRTAVTLYEKPRGLDNKQKVGGGSGKKRELPKGPATPAVELNILAQGELEKPISTSELHAINKIVKGFIVVGNMENLDRVKMYLDENMIPKAVQGLSVDGEYLTSPFLATDGNIQGIDQRAFFEMVKVALNWGLGIKMEIEGTKIQDILAETSGMEIDEKHYSLGYEDLLEKYGELP